MTNEQGVTIDLAMEEDMLQLIQKHQGEIDGYDDSDFQKIFWMQQVMNSPHGCYYISVNVHVIRSQL